MTLPELDTSNIGLIAFWNHLDNGALEINPTDVENVLTSSKRYTNGIDGTYGFGFANQPTLPVNVRVKDDGWLIAWLPQTQEEVSGVGGNTLVTGYQNFHNDWTATDANGDSDIMPSNPTLERVVKALHGALANSGGSTYNPGDVAFYDYGHPSATSITQTGYSTSDFVEGSYDLTPSSDATIHHAVATSAGARGTATFGSISVGDDTGSNAVAVVNAGLTPGQATTFTQGSYDWPSHVTALVIWS